MAPYRRYATETLHGRPSSGGDRGTAARSGDWRATRSGGTRRGGGAAACRSGDDCIGCTEASMRWGIEASRGGDGGWRRCSRRATGAAAEPDERRGALGVPAADPRPDPRHRRLPLFDRKPRPGLAIHRSRTLTPSDITRRHGIAVTTPARTIEDIRGCGRALPLPPRAPSGGARRAPRAAPRPRQAARAPTSSCSSSAFCERPRPAASARQPSASHGHRVDFFWPEHRVAVETDSWDYHRGSVAFEDDHDRDLALRAPRDHHPPLHRRPARSRSRCGRRRPAGSARPRLVECGRWPTRPSSS